MVTTIDGKIVTGNRGEHVGDLGSSVDHELMRKIEAAADAVLIGAGAQRSTAQLWYPNHLYRFVVTNSGNVLTPSRFFDDAPERAVVICPEEASLPPLSPKVRRMHESDWQSRLAVIRSEYAVSKLLVEGGSEINAQLLELDVVDELFLTLAPKIKLGKDVPTYADGDALPRSKVQEYVIIEQHRIGDELFVRYRRKR